MPLINCPECNKKVSDSAFECPRCGFPLDEDDDEYEDEFTDSNRKSPFVRIACGVILGLMAFSLIFRDSDPTPAPADIEFTIVEDEGKRDVKRTVDVLIGEKLTQEHLEQLSLHLISLDSTDYERTYINFSIPDSDQPKSPHRWASTTFDSDGLDAKIDGVSIAQEAAYRAMDTSADKEIVAIWLDERCSSCGAQVLKQEGNEYFVGMIGSPKVQLSTLSYKAYNISKYGEKFKLTRKDENSPSEFFIINKGYLEYWSKSSGHYYTAKPIPLKE